MKLKIQMSVILSYGKFTTKPYEYSTQRELDELKEAAQLAVSKGNYFSFVSEEGDTVVVGADALRSAVFVLKKI